MKLKLIIALVSDEKTDTVLEAGREAGATGASVITSVRGEGLKKEKSFFGLDLAASRDLVLFIVAATSARSIMEHINDVAKFDEEPGTGVAFQISIEDAVGMTTQLPTLLQETEEKI